jgi:hypothetical protein
VGILANFNAPEYSGSNTFFTGTARAGLGGSGGSSSVFAGTDGNPGQISATLMIP